MPRAVQQFTIELEGETLALHYEFQDFAAAEERLGIPLYGPLAAPTWDKNTPAAQLALLLFIGLHRDKPGLSLAQARALIDWENASYVELTVTEAFQAAMPRPSSASVAASDGEEAEASPLAVPTPGFSGGA